MAIDVRDFTQAEPEDVGMSGRRLANLTAWARSQVDQARIPGVITMVARGGRTVHFDVYGQMDVEAGKPMAPGTIFRIYSMTKPIVSLALMTLYEEGRFQLDDPAARFIPEFKNLKVFAGGTPEHYELRDPARPMTIRDLLMHTGGLPGLYGLDPAADRFMTPVQHMHRNAGISTFPDNGDTLKDMAAKFAQLPLQVDPGANWIYGLSTDMVGYLCEVLSGQPLDRFLEERIFQPLGMVDTGFHVAPSNVDRLAACYRLGQTGEPRFVLQDPPTESRFARPPSLFSGVAGLTSTAADYMRFAKMLASGGQLDGRRIIGPRTVKLMASNHLPEGRDLASMTFSSLGPSPAGIGFGLGFGVLLDPAKAQILGTPGEFYWSGAAATAFFVSPQDDLVALFMTQLMLALPYQFGRYLRTTTYQALID